MKTECSKIPVEVVSVTELAQNIKRFDLKPCNGTLFSDLRAGAHVMLEMAEGLTRPYSLIVSGAQLHTCAIAVLHEKDGTGGSRFMHTQVSKGSILSLEPPTNGFPLVSEHSMSIFIAGGIGITPIWSMIQECERSSQPWKLFYAARSRSEAAFVDDLESSPHVLLRFSDAQRGRLDLKEIVKNAPSDAHLYCCGPTGMIEGFRDAANERPPSQVHFESFVPLRTTEKRQPITVQLARTGKTIQVLPDESILGALLQAGVFLAARGHVGIAK
jgi:ferredoxin-NADP reductase